MGGTNVSKGTHISLFAGVGMTDIAVEAQGYKTVAWAENDTFCQSVLRRRFPDAWPLADVRQVTVNDDALRHAVRGPLLISGGFPCQDVAALRGQKDGILRSRTGLWTEFARIIREFRPDHVLIENSPMLRRRGLNRVLHDLHDRGYSAAWDCIPAAAVGAPMLRDRLWVMAWPHDPLYRIGVVTLPDVLPRAGTIGPSRWIELRPGHTVKDSKTKVKFPRMFPSPRAHMNEWRTTRNAPSHGNGHGKTLAGELNSLAIAAGDSIPKSSDNAGNVNPEWVEWLMGLPQGWTDPDVDNRDLIPHNGWTREPVERLLDIPERRHRLRTLGNGLVPQVASVALNELSLGGTP